MLTRDSILNADDLKRELVNVPEWNGTVYVRVLTGAQRDCIDQMLYANRTGKDPIKNIRATYLAASLCDDTGALLFKPEDIAALGEKSAAALDRLFAVVQRLNKIGPKDLEEAKGN
jgi:hypothetical protein